MVRYPEVAKRFSYILDLRGITAGELSRRSGVGKSSISHYCHGTHSPHSLNAGALASVLLVDPMWLMGFDVPMVEKGIGMDFGNSSAGIFELGKLYTYIGKLNDEGLKKAEEYLADLADMEKYTKK